MDLINYRPVPGFPGYFAGEDAVVVGLWRRPLKPTRGKNGYYYLVLSFGSRENRKKRNLGRHEVICLAFHGPPPDENMEVRHLDGIRGNDTPDNLCWGTGKENYEDRIRHGTYGAGELNPAAKLNETKVAEIRGLLSKRMSPRKIARLYGVGKSLIYNIRNGKNWTFNHAIGKHEDKKLNVFINRSPARFK